ncbi:MAG TPA: outer membrane beta-barrel protein [Bauldia sp.]|nr:outer membrane beta-barrel protein [Bauldia sp.]
MLRTLIAAALGVAALGGAAQAADWGGTTYNWSGLYVGAFGGGISGTITPSSGSNSGPSGADLGLTVSYAWQSASNWVLTPFVAIPIAGQTGNYGGGVPVRIDWSVVGGLKLGYAIDRWQPYAFVAAVTGGATATPGASESHQHTGVAFGLGADYALTDRWSIGARYAHVSVGAQTYFNSFNVGWDGDSFAGTISYKLR